VFREKFSSLVDKNGKKIEDIKKAIDANYSRYWPYEKRWPL